MTETDFGIFPQQQTGGLPHAQIYDIEVKNIKNGYELWISCASRGVAVLTVDNNPTNINETESQANSFILKQNYPNPFNPLTNLEFGISDLGFVSLKVYNILGKEVASIVSENLSPGTYKYIFNGSEYSSGIYFYTLKTNGFSETKRMILMK